MRLEFLPDGSPDCPLIRLYSFDSAEIQQLRSLVSELSTGSRDYVAVHELPRVNALGGCRLNFRVGAKDEGVREQEPGLFECVLSSSGWDNLEGLLEPFLKSDELGFQWLSDHGSISMLLSRDGSW